MDYEQLHNISKYLYQTKKPTSKSLLGEIMKILKRPIFIIFEDFVENKEILQRNQSKFLNIINLFFIIPSYAYS